MKPFENHMGNSSTLIASSMQFLSWLRSQSVRFIIAPSSNPPCPMLYLKNASLFPLIIHHYLPNLWIIWSVYEMTIKSQLSAICPSKSLSTALDTKLKWQGLGLHRDQKKKQKWKTFKKKKKENLYQLLSMKNCFPLLEFYSLFGVFLMLLAIGKSSN